MNPDVPPAGLDVSPQRRPQVFLCRDDKLDALLDQLVQALLDRGIEVVRGPQNVPGQVAELPVSLLGSLLGGTDVAMVSSRWRCSRDTLLAAPLLRGIVNPTVGLETVDVDAASDLGIIVGHGATPENYISMAEATVMLMLNLMYGLRQTEDLMRKGQAMPAFGAEHARMLHRKTNGVIGLGRIGRAVLERLIGFGVRLLVHSTHANPASLPTGTELVDLETVMRESDIVGVFIAVRPDNYRIVNARTLFMMKPGAYLVNVSRGCAVDEPALIEALTQGRIAGAALDTFAREPLPDDSPIALHGDRHCHAALCWSHPGKHRLTGASCPRQYFACATPGVAAVLHERPCGIALARTPAWPNSAPFAIIVLTAIKEDK